VCVCVCVCVCVLLWDNFIADSGVLFPWQLLEPVPFATEEMR